MRYLIFEDERCARGVLERMMRKLRPGYSLVGWAQGVEQAAELIGKGGFDLIITDIRLADGLCFEVFERQPTDTSVIFTTAYDEYAIKAFDLNSIDYLLKPIEEGDLSDALGKLERNTLLRTSSSRFEAMEKSYMSHTLKSRFLIRIGDTYRYLPTADVAAFFSEDKATFLCTAEGKRYIVDYSLDQIEPMLDPQVFFRLSRAFIANIRSIGRVSKYFGGRLCVELAHGDVGKIIVSRRRANNFLKWMGGDE